MKYMGMLILAFLIGAGPLNSQEFVISRALDYANGYSDSYPGVGPGDTVWIEAGSRIELKITNFHGNLENPVVFANLNGQVIVETNENFGISFESCSFFKLAGQSGKGYDYGFHIARVSKPGGTGISASAKSTNFEISNCEISNIGFAGIMAKTEPLCEDPGTYRNAFTQRNTIIHDCYIHDVGGEGIYAGHFSYLGYTLGGCGNTVLPSVLIGTRIHHNRIERTGYDGIQVTSAVEDCEISHNILVQCGYRMESGQMSGILIGGGTLAKCFNNTILDCYGTGILVFGKGGTEVYNNLIIRPGRKYLPDDPEKPEGGIFLADKSGDEKTFYGLYNNTIIQPKSDGIRIDNSVNFEVRIFNNAILDPGAFNHYENDDTDWTGADSYIYDTGKAGLFVTMNNFFRTSLAEGGFVYVSGDDFHLKSSSPLVDSGSDLGQYGVVTDLDDRIRPLGKSYDIGAYEYDPVQSVDVNHADADFSVENVRTGPDKTLLFVLEASRNMKVRLRLVDVLGKVLYDQPQEIMDRGIQEFAIPAVAGGLVLLLIQSDRLSYARKIVIL